MSGEPNCGLGGGNSTLAGPIAKQLTMNYESTTVALTDQLPAFPENETCRHVTVNIVHQSTSLWMICNELGSSLRSYLPPSSARASSISQSPSSNSISSHDRKPAARSAASIRSRSSGVGGRVDWPRRVFGHSHGDPEAQTEATSVWSCRCLLCWRGCTL